LSGAGFEPAAERVWSVRHWRSTIPIVYANANWGLWAVKFSNRYWTAPASASTQIQLRNPDSCKKLLPPFTHLLNSNPSDYGTKMPHPKIGLSIQIVWMITDKRRTALKRDSRRITIIAAQRINFHCVHPVSKLYFVYIENIVHYG